MEFDFPALPQRTRYNLLIGLIAPRPIALVTSLDLRGRLNAAPFSAFNYVGTDPALVVLGVGNRPDDPGADDGGPPRAKDTALNIRARGEFVVHVVSEGIADGMNLCATDFPRGESEVAAAGFTTVPATRVGVPRLAEAPACLECVEVQTFERGRSRVVVGEVVYAHVRDEFVDPRGPYVRAEELHAIGRMNGLGAYVRTRGAFFQVPRIPYAEWKKQALPGDVSPSS